jgi:hypothetical protein
MKCNNTFHFYVFINFVWILCDFSFRREVEAICAILGYYAAYSGNSLTMFRDNLSASSSMIKKYKLLSAFCTLNKSIYFYWFLFSLKNFLIITF